MSMIRANRLANRFVTEDGSMVGLDFAGLTDTVTRLEMQFQDLDALIAALMDLQHQALKRQEDAGNLQKIEDQAAHLNVDRLRVVANVTSRDMILQVGGAQSSTPSPGSPWGLRLSLKMAHELVAHLEKSIALLSGHQTKQ
jgi:hypothetical protein